MLGRPPGEGKGYPLQYSGLENPMDYSPWGHKELDTTERLHFHALEKAMATHSSVLAWRIPWTIVHGVTKSWTRLSNFHFHFSWHQLDLCSGASSLLTRVKWQPSESCLHIIMKIVLTLQIPGKFLKAPRGSVKNSLITPALNIC